MLKGKTELKNKGCYKYSCSIHLKYCHIAYVSRVCLQLALSICNLSEQTFSPAKKNIPLHLFKK